jgi:membrane protein DedA with SNARE-associated domain
MSTLLERLVAWGQQLVDTLGYIGLAVIMFVENVFPPMPSEPFLLGAGFSSGQGGLSLVGALIAATIGAIVGATFWYGVGLILPEQRIRQLLRRYGRWAMLGEDDLDRALAWFRDHGRLVILFGRCIPIVRSLISVPAGLTRMGLPQFLLYTAIGTAAWSALLIGVGVVLGENWEQALGFFDRYDTVLLAVMALVVVAFFANRLRRRRTAPVGRHERARVGDPSRSDVAPGAAPREVPQAGGRNEVPPGGGRHERGRGHDHERIGY